MPAGHRPHSNGGLGAPGRPSLQLRSLVATTLSLAHGSGDLGPALEEALAARRENVAQAPAPGPPGAARGGLLRGVERASGLPAARGGERYLFSRLGVGVRGGLSLRPGRWGGGAVPVGRLRLRGQLARRGREHVAGWARSRRGGDGGGGFRRSPALGRTRGSPALRRTAPHPPVPP